MSTKFAQGAVMSQLFGLATHWGHVVRSKMLGRAIAVLAARQRREKIVVFMLTFWF